MQFTSGPVISPNPNKRAPLAAILEFATDAPSTATVEIDNGTRKWSVPFDGEAATEHRLPIVGMRPGAEHRLRVTARGAGGDETASEALTFTAPSLPDDFPPISIDTCVPEKREPGVMMFSIRYSPATKDRPDFGLVVAVDQDGDIVWSYHWDTNIGDVRRLANGNILVVYDGAIAEVDLLGNTVREWYAKRRFADKTAPAGAIPVDAEMFHHACIELPSGNLLACSIEFRDLPDWPATEGDPAGGTETAHVVGDVIVEFDRDGNIVNEFRLLDLLDPYRLCYGSRARYWILRGYPDTCDWSHVNGLSHDGSDDSFVASVRHQDCIIKIDRQSGELKWILGTHANWKAPWSEKLLTPEDGLEWQFHQHDCSITAPATVLCFDNGNFRVTPFDAKPDEAISYSRAVEFAVDESAGRVRQVWHYGDGADGPGKDRCYSTYQSGAYRLPATGNSFIDYGGVCSVDGHASTKIDQGHCQARVIEVTPGDKPEIVFELSVNDSSDDPATLSSFRAEHFPSLYPDQ